MKSTTAFHVAWILVGCIFSEAAFMVVQIGLSLMTFDKTMTLHDLLSPDNPLYAIPPHFMIVGIVFVAAIIYAEYRHLYKTSYYVLAAILAAILYFISLWMSGMALSFGDTIINLVAAVVSGIVYWWITPRRYNRHTLNTY
ncbi:hypothetical protein [uncultured Bartonella sp.]|uniref:hypothetical protein n=1 Tax=uncultured Bartonella sp. TaxID=104108 RepID=UPI00262AD1B7|nr:hypothetical protein [uncultured Bartonella sp.]